jgi:hypothetical protein
MPQETAVALSLQVLEGLLAEDDRAADVWYLLGLALHAGGSFDEAAAAADEAERLVARRRADGAKSGGDGDDAAAAGELLLDIAELKVGHA